MCSAAIKLTSKALNSVTNAEVLLKIKGFIALFIQTMEVSFRSIRHCQGSSAVRVMANKVCRAGDTQSQCLIIFFLSSSTSMPNS